VVDHDRSLASTLVRVPTPVAQFARGFVMGTADIVPGVSGGTVALVLGIYERLIRNIHLGAQALKALLSGDVETFGAKLRSIQLVWLASLLAGMLVAIAVLASVLERLLEEQPVRMAALFFGLVAGAVVVAWRLMRTIDVRAIALMAVVAVALFVLLGLRTDTSSGTSGDEVVTQPLWIFFITGAFAICAMILPGVSGSFILVMVGMYSEVLGAVNERDVLTLGVFALGCVVGLALFSSVLDWLLKHHHDVVVAALIGLMLGSLRVLWPWPGGTDTTTLAMPADDIVVPVVLAVLGFAVVVGVELAGQRFTRSARREMPSTMSSSPSANENRA
jgi:putative membrane protein